MWIALAIDGKQRSSEEMAAWMEDLGVRGESHLQFIIGGSLGLSQAVLNRADTKISFSRLTFPHQLMSRDFAGTDLPEFPDYKRRTVS